MRVGSPRRPLVSSRFGGKTQTSSRREGEWLKRADRFMSPSGDWGLNWGFTRPFCQLTYRTLLSCSSRIVFMQMCILLYYWANKMMMMMMMKRYISKRCNFFVTILQMFNCNGGSLSRNFVNNVPYFLRDVRLLMKETKRCHD